MIKNLVCMLFILAFLKTGISNSSISISYDQDGDTVIVSCVLSGNERLTQINWEMLQGSNRIKLGIFHPMHGTHILSENVGKIKIQGKDTPHASSSLYLENLAVNKSEQICCLFTMFPSGSLMQCTGITDKDEPIIANMTNAEPQKADHKMGLIGQLGALMIGSILSLLLILILVYLCKKCFCRRKQAFEVQQVYLTDPTTSTDTFAEERQEVQNPLPPSGFDPAKLYAKIKEDLYYGRLWKAYQGQARVSTQASGQRQIYYRLGENLLAQRDEEDRPRCLDTTTSSSDSNSLADSP